MTPVGGAPGDAGNAPTFARVCLPRAATSAAKGPPIGAGAPSTLAPGPGGSSGGASPGGPPGAGALASPGTPPAAGAPISGGGRRTPRAFARAAAAFCTGCSVFLLRAPPPIARAAAAAARRVVREPLTLPPPSPGAGGRRGGTTIAPSMTETGIVGRRTPLRGSDFARAGGTKGFNFTLAFTFGFGFGAPLPLPSLGFGAISAVPHSGLGESSRPPPVMRPLLCRSSPPGSPQTRPERRRPSSTAGRPSQICCRPAAYRTASLDSRSVTRAPARSDA